ncbi:MAG: glycoside hydrolase family 25 protein [Candidatus Xenobia bacterium]
MPEPAPPSPHGDFADVSHWESGVDWNAYAASGRKLAVCKATESTTYVDPTFAANRAALSKLGLYCGIYHFAGSSVKHKIGDAVQEADFFVNQIGPLGPKEFPIVDFEIEYKLSPQQQVQWLNHWCQEVQDKTGKAPWIYTDSGMLKQWDATSLRPYPLWLANINPPHDPAHPPASGSWPQLVAWQYSFTVRIPGIGTCDDSFLYGDLQRILEKTEEGSAHLRPPGRDRRG